MIDSASLLTDLKLELRALEADLRARAEHESSEWGARLREEHRRAQARERTGLAWIDWRDGEVSQAAVAWIIATVFIRFAEDNGLLAGATRDGRSIALPWIAAPGDGLDRAVENESAFYAVTPTMTSRDWLQDAFRTLADLPAGRTLVDPDHSAVWQAPISAVASDALLGFFRRTTPEGALVHDFSDPELSTRFLGDLYQELSDYAKKTYALLQTPIFVEEFILDQTLTPAVAEFGLTGLKVIDPACGSGHFLLGAFDRLAAAWAEAAPGVDRGERVQRALNSINGVDLNPFAIAITRFRLTVAAIKAAGIRTLIVAPAFRYHLAIGDSLLGGSNVEGGLNGVSMPLDLGDGEDFEYDAEDLREYAGILAPGQYHVVVANPPYITVKDRVLNQRYRSVYPMCVGPYALTVPFMELLFRLARRPEGAAGAGFVGQITSNSFTKREFGKKLIEQFLSGEDLATRVDLTHIIDTSGAYIPGHGTPTVILIGRRRKPTGNELRAVLGIRGEPSVPVDAAMGQVWREMVAHIAGGAYDGGFVTVADVPRARFTIHPWSLSGGGASDLLAILDACEERLSGEIDGIGRTTHTGLDDAFFRPIGYGRLHRIPDTIDAVFGDGVRDYQVEVGLESLFPYDDRGEKSEVSEAFFREVWRLRTPLAARVDFGATPAQRGLRWFDHSMFFPKRFRVQLGIAFSNVQTHNHFALDRGGNVFTSHSPVVRLPDGANEDDHFKLLGVLNSSTSLFWLKQVSYPKGGDPIGGDGARVSAESWSDRYEFTSSNVQELPLPEERASDVSRQLDGVVQRRTEYAPGAALARGGVKELKISAAEWSRLGDRLVALQEELDWQMYVAYALVGPELAPKSGELVPIEPNQRPFEIRLARDVAAGAAATAWFDRHGRTPLTEFPAHWPSWYRELAQRRLAATESNPSLRILEQPEYKRRWAGATWEQLVDDAVQTALLDRLGATELWHDASGRPVVRSSAQVADELRRDERFRELLTIHTGSQDYDLSAEVGKLLAGKAVPGLAALRFKDSGMEKFRAWERTWELQRAEDRGEQVTVPVPPKYAPADFLKSSFWSARGKLDVPKERFIAFPGSKLPDDASELYGWAGWDHGERGQAVARLANDLSRAGASSEQIVPLVGVLIEIEPWLKQWHDEIDARSGVSPAAAVAGITTTLLVRLGIGRDGVESWRPAPATRGRRSA